MSFSVIVTESTKPPTKGAPTATDTWFVTGVAKGGDLTKPQYITSMEDFEGYYTDRSVAGSEPLYDALDTFFGEGGAHAYVGAYAATGTFDDGLALLNDWRLGPGQVSVIGATPDATLFQTLSDFCLDTNRVGLLDVQQADTVADMETLAALLPANEENMGLFGGWAQIPGPHGVIGGGPRFVPASPVIAGLCSRVDSDGNINRGVGGRDYPLQYVKDLVLDPTSAERTALQNAGVNMLTDDFRVLINAGFQTNIPASAYEDTPFWQLNAARARMWLKANAIAVGANYFMRPIDGQGRLAAQLKSDLDALCKQLYDANGLFGATPQEAYKNTVTIKTTDVAQGIVDVTCEARFSLYAKTIKVNLVSVPVTASV